MAGIRSGLYTAGRDHKEMVNNMMNKKATILTAALVSSVALAAPVAGDVHAGWTGSSSCSSATQVCSYNFNSLHYTDIIDVPDVGEGKFIPEGAGYSLTCIFTSANSCTAGGFAGVVGPGGCSTWYKATSQSLLVGGYDENRRQYCNPW